jgi:uncharacterized protein with ATP-grasp and redox domains
VVIDFRRQSYQKEKVTVIMRTYFDCIPCIIRQALDAIRLINDDEKKHEQILREVLFLANKMDLSESPPAMAQKIHRVIRQLTETDDPYKEMKGRFNDFALQHVPRFQKLLATSEKPFETAVRLAIAGNIIDLGVKCSLTMLEVEKTIDQALIVPFDMKDFEDFRKATVEATNILYMADNAGEIVFDRFLIEQLGPEKITLVVKGKPVINDATVEDAQAAGLTDLVRVIDNGDDAPGTILKSCSREFQQRFEKADLIIAKGQGNYETLSDVDKNMFFILRAKCPVIAGHLNCTVGTLVLRKNRIPKIKQLIEERS